MHRAHRRLVTAATLARRRRRRWLILAAQGVVWAGATWSIIFALWLVGLASGAG